MDNNRENNIILTHEGFHQLVEELRRPNMESVNLRNRFFHEIDETLTVCNHGTSFIISIPDSDWSQDEGKGLLDEVENIVLDEFVSSFMMEHEFDVSFTLSFFENLHNQLDESSLNRDYEKEERLSIYDPQYEFAA